MLGRIHTGSGSVPDSSESYASGRLRVGFAFTLLTSYPTRMVRRVHTASALRPVVTQLVAYIMFPGHELIVSRVDHVLTKATSGNQFSAVILPISTSCMLISQHYTFTPQCHDFYARDLQHYELMEWKEIGQSADMRRRRVATVPKRVHSSIHTAAPTRHIPFASTANTS